MNNEQDIRTKIANIDKRIIIENLNEMYNELYQTQGIYRFLFNEETQMIIVDFGDDEPLEIYVKGWTPAIVIKKVFEEICVRLVLTSVKS